MGSRVTFSFWQENKAGIQPGLPGKDEVQHWKSEVTVPIKDVISVCLSIRPSSSWRLKTSSWTQPPLGNKFDPLVIINASLMLVKPESKACGYFSVNLNHKCFSVLDSQTSNYSTGREKQLMMVEEVRSPKRDNMLPGRRDMKCKSVFECVYTLNGLCTSIQCLFYFVFFHYLPVFSARLASKLEFQVCAKSLPWHQHFCCGDCGITPDLSSLSTTTKTQLEWPQLRLPRI